MVTKAARQHRICGLLASESFSSQDALCDALRGEGIDVTQATLSRDLRDLQVIKTPQGYALPDDLEVPSVQLGRRPVLDHSLEQACRRELLAARHGGQMVVCQTRPGHANALAVVLDAAPLDGKLGTIAGDDTIFICASSTRAASSIARQLRSWSGLNGT